MSRYLFFCLVVMLPISTAWAQLVPLDDINIRRNAYTRNGMITLNSWSFANVVSGTIGIITAKDKELKHFYEMNIYWNAVNLGICIPSLVNALKEKKQGLTFQESLKKQHSAEKVFLFNGFLDISYITTGFLLREIGNNNKPAAVRARLRGYGESLIMQGGFLMFFDFIEYILHSKNGKRLDAHWQNISLRPAGQFGLGVGLHLNFN